MINNTKEQARITKFLETKVFPIDFLDHSFECEIEIFNKNLEEESNLIESLIHNNTQSASFSVIQLNRAVYNTCKLSNLTNKCYSFNVNVHDNVARIVENINYFKLNDPKFRFASLYQILISNRAVQGGTSYSGLLSLNEDWFLIIELENTISIKVIGNKTFCNNMTSELRSTPVNNK